MGIENELKNLERELESLTETFLSVASAIEEEYPKLWKEAFEMFQDRENAAKFLASPSRYFNDKSLLETAMGSSEEEERVLNYIAAINHGVFM